MIALLNVPQLYWYERRCRFESNGNHARVKPEKTGTCALGYEVLPVPSDIK